MAEQRSQVCEMPERVVADVEQALRDITADLYDPGLTKFNKIRDILGRITLFRIGLADALENSLRADAYGTAFQISAVLEELRPRRAGLARSARCVKGLMQRAEADLDVRVAPDEDGLNP